MEWILAPFMLPYLGLVGYDAALHPHRKVPFPEFILHAVAGLLIATFLTASLLKLNTVACVSLLLAVPVMLADELGFHSRIGKHERRIHQFAFLALSAYAGVWYWIR